MRSWLCRTLGSSIRRQDCRRGDNLGPQADRRRNPRRAIQPPAVHALRGANVCLGLPRGGLAEDLAGSGGVRRREVHGLPLLHAGVPVPGSDARMEQAPAEDAKCDMCYERQSQGKQTACAEVCPTGATKNGDRDELLAEARQRIAEKPGQYYGKIYGVKEAGGTSVLFLSAVPFGQIGLHTNVPQEALPDLTWRVLALTPDVVSTGSVLLGGVWWITNRRGEVAKKEGRRK